LEEAILKADVLIEALTWIREFRGKITVIKLGGSVMEDDSAMVHLLLDVVFMETVGMRPVIVHGGGAAISRAMVEAGAEARFIHGRRYTDDTTLDIVERVLAGDVNRRLAERINELGGAAESLNFETTNVLFGERIRLPGEDGQSIDLGHVGQVTRVDGETITGLCRKGIVPVIPSMCVAEGGEKLNVKEANRLIEDGTVAAGMIPKVQACLETLERGVHKVHIIDGRLRHSLLLEVYTSKGVGTQLTKGDEQAA
jgi:acetylglutamate kinase